MKFNRIGEYVAYELHEDFHVHQYTIYQNGWAVTSKEQFWSRSTNIARVKLRCTKGSAPL
jgi:hypothetical protein